MKKILFLCIYILIPGIVFPQYVKDWRYELGGVDGLQNLRGTNFYPYPSDYETPKELVLKWSKKFDNSVIYFLTGDVTGDGLLEVVVCHTNSISVLNSSGNIIKQIEVQGILDEPGFLEDFDNDGSMEIFVAQKVDSTAAISVLSYEQGEEIATFKKKCTDRTKIRPYGIFGNNVFGNLFTGHRAPPGSRGYIAFDRIETNEQYLYEGGAVINVSSISDMNNDGNYMISNYSSAAANGAIGDGVNHNGTYTNDSTAFAVVIDDEGNEIFTFDFKKNGNPLGNMWSFFLDSGNQKEEKLLILSSEDSKLPDRNIHYIINIETGQVEQTYESDIPDAWCAVIADINNDSIEEIIASRVYNKLLIFDQELNVIKERQLQTTVLLANDINGDGEIDIVCGPGETIFVLDKNLNEQWRYTFPTGVNANLRISDLDFNGRNEIIASAYSTESYEIFVVEAADNPEYPAPENLTALSSPDEILLRWDILQNRQAESFNIYRHSEPWFKVDDSFLIGTVDGSDNEFRDYNAELKNNFYKITAVYEGGTESFSSEVALGTIIKISWLKANRVLLFIIFSSILFAAGLAFINRVIKIRRDQAGKLAHVFKDAPVSTIILTSNGKLTYFNKAAAELLYSIFILKIGEDFLDLLSRYNMPDWHNTINGFIDENDLEIRRELPLSDNQNTRSILVILRKMPNSKNDTLINITAIDISNYLTTKNALAWTSMAHALAHEIKNPLTSIQLALQSLNMHYLSKDQIASDDAQKYVESIDEDIERIRHETNRLMQFSMSSRSEKSALNVNSLLRKVLRLYEILENGNVKLTIEVAEGLTAVANKDMLELAFKNIVENSLDALQGRGNINIRGNAEDYISDESNSIKMRLRIEFTDSGCGISETNLSRIFDPKFTTKEMGAGFGLSIVRHIIEDHKGSIEINSKLMIGTSVIVTLPLYQE
ncbi:ATP-binding protein [candidate division KSB1 bacterium]